MSSTPRSTRRRWQVDREHATAELSDALWQVRRTPVLARAATVRTWPVSFLVFSAVICCVLLLLAGLSLLATTL